MSDHILYYHDKKQIKPYFWTEALKVKQESQEVLKQNGKKEEKLSTEMF